MELFATYVATFVNPFAEVGRTAPLATDRPGPLVAASALANATLPTNCLCHDKDGWSIVNDDSVLTICFINGVLLLFPSVLLLVGGLLEANHLKKTPKGSSRSVHHVSFTLKFVLLALQLLLVLLTISSSLTLSSAAWYSDISVLSPVLSLIALLVGIYLHYIETFLAVLPSSTLLFYWLFSFVGYGLAANHYVSYMDGLHTEKYRQISVNFTLMTINALAILFIEKINLRIAPAVGVAEQKKSPVDEADIFQKLLFTWVTPLIEFGYKNYLREEDLPPMPKDLTANHCQSEFESAWNAAEAKNKTPSVVSTLVKAFGWNFFVAGVFKGIQDVLQFVQPQLLRVLLQFVEDYNAAPNGLPLARGFLIVACIFMTAVVQTLFLHQYFKRGFETGMRIRLGLTGAIYEKALVLSNEEREGRSSGDIVNLMAVDTQRMQDLTTYLHIAWSGPFQLVICLVSLYNLLGKSMIGGLLVMILMIPFNALLARQQKKFQNKQMKYKDERSKMTSEILTNIKSLKLYGWEIPYSQKLTHIREDLELKNLTSIGVLMGFSTMIWNVTPMLVSIATFTMFVLWEGRTLTTDIVFPALALFNLLQFPLVVIPMVISNLIEASVAAARLNSFMRGSELQKDAVIRTRDAAVSLGDVAVSVKKGLFLWSREPYKAALADIDFNAKKGDLACIVGRVGSGKSALLQAILGGLYRESGEVLVKGTVAYVSQVPWIMNASVKDNILFGCKNDPEFYRTTIEACALKDDFAILPDGDQTMVGEKGISLSGGQKARIALARAVYARADVYILDDPLSAVDEHVGKHIIDNVLGEEGLLSRKAVILATNSIPVLSHASSICMLVDGKLTESGTFSEIMQSKGSIYQVLMEFGKKKSPSSSATSVVNGESDDQTEVEIEDYVRHTPPGSTTASSQPSRRASVSTIRRASVASYTTPPVADAETDNRKTRQEEEHSEKGQVKRKVYLAYLDSMNKYGILLWAVCLVGSQLGSVGGNVWLKHWAEVNEKVGRNDYVSYYLGIYGTISFLCGLGIFTAAMCLLVFCVISSARKLHKNMFASVIRAKMSFFETTPVGRIINRFTNDIYKVDTQLAQIFSNFASNVVKVSLTMIIIIQNTPAIIALLIPLAVLYLWYQRYYLRTNRELKRIDSVTKSPIYAHFQETLYGLSTIRAFNQLGRFEFINLARLEANIGAYYYINTCNRWLGVRLETVGSLITTAAAGLSVYGLKNGITSGAVGLTMSYAMSMTQSLNWIVRMSVELETSIVSVERILEYSELESEAPAIIEDHRPPATWPEAGAIEFNDYCTRYRPELDLVLKNICLKIKPQEKVGIVGRTGAGKSSLTLALFRMIEASSGFISIDGLDTSTIGLSDLRHNLSIIPQDSQAFEGTVRDNLDPAGSYDDTELWRALELSHLKAHIDKMDGKLDAHVAEGGSNFSVGQRQLLCLARALLTPAKILVLDEATAAVDVETDKLLQETIRSAFKDRTILTIAHRLNTVMDSDKIIVLDKGKVAEFDSPENLLANTNSLFYGLCKQGGFVE